MTARSVLSKLAAILLLLAPFGCGGSQTPGPDTPGSGGDAPPDEGAQGGQGLPENDTKPMSHGAKKTNDDGAAEDYMLTERDCSELGKQYVAVQRADQIAQLDSKLTAKQRETAITNIDNVVGKMGEPWANGCIESLVGKVADRKRLACAMSSKSVKAFDDCLNADKPPQ